MFPLYKISKYKYISSYLFPVARPATRDPSYCRLWEKMALALRLAQCQATLRCARGRAPHRSSAAAQQRSSAALPGRDSGIPTGMSGELMRSVRLSQLHATALARPVERAGRAGRAGAVVNIYISVGGGFINTPGAQQASAGKTRFHFSNINLTIMTDLVQPSVVCG